MAEAMDWAEIKMRLRDGTSVDILADLNGVPYKTMYNRIMAHQIKDNVTYLTPKNTRGGMNKSKAISKTKQAQAKAKEKKAAQKSAERPEVNPAITEYNCATCANVIARPESYSCTDGHIEIEKYCTKGHSYGGTNICCSDYVTSALEPFIKAPEKKQDIPEEVYNMRRQLQPETIEELKEQYRTCMQLAERYQKQAEDWKKIIDTFGTSHPGAQGLPEVMN